MISSISSSAISPNASMRYEQQIQALDSQVMSLETKIGGLQEKIIDVQGSERLSAAEKKGRIRSINEQIGQVRERVQDIKVRISEAQKQKAQAESEAKRRQKAAEAREQARPENEGEAADSALLHAIIGIDQRPGGLKAAKAQLNSRLREANKEDMFRVRPDGKMVMIHRDNRRPRDPVEARNAQRRIADIDERLLRDKSGKADALKKSGRSNPHAEKPPSPDENLQNDNHDNRRPSGTGRMGKGQYVEAEA